MGSVENDGVTLLHQFLKVNPQVRIIRYQWLDLGGILRCICVTTDYALQLGSKPHSVSELSLDLLPNNGFGPNFHAIGTDGLYADWATLQVCRYANDRQATVMCYVKEGKAWFPEFYSCPRSILRNTLAEAERSHGLKFLVGCECEFFLLDKEKSVKEAVGAEQAGGQYTAMALRSDSINNLLQEMVFCLQDSGIQVQSFQGEGEGYEIVTGPRRPMESIDTLMYVRETIYTLSARRGYRATFYPLPYTEEHGVTTLSSIGAHTHLSLDSPTPEQADQFLAGVLDCLPSLYAFGLPTHDSYARVKSLGQAGQWVAYGTENKDCPLRAMQNQKGYWELRFADATANAYVFVAAVIAAGCRGIREKLPLKQKDVTKGT